MNLDLDVCEDILTLLEKGPRQWSELAKMMTCTPHSFNSTLNFLKISRYVEKKGASGSRSPYQLTTAGKQFLEALPKFKPVPVPNELYEALSKKAIKCGINVDDLANAVFEEVLSDQDLVRKLIRGLKEGPQEK